MTASELIDMILDDNLNQPIKLKYDNKVYYAEFENGTLVCCDKPFQDDFCNYIYLDITDIPMIQSWEWI